MTLFASSLIAVSHSRVCIQTALFFKKLERLCRQFFIRSCVPREEEGGRSFESDEMEKTRIRKSRRVSCALAPAAEPMAGGRVSSPTACSRLHQEYAPGLRPRPVGRSEGLPGCFGRRGAWTHSTVERERGASVLVGRPRWALHPASEGTAAPLRPLTAQRRPFS